MTEPKHTPGPWGVHEHYSVIGIYGDDPAYPMVLSLPKWESMNPEEIGRYRANAHLISAAPDMLAALKSIEWSNRDTIDCQTECPSCGGTNPAEGYEWALGHDDGCELKAAIDKATR